MFPSIPECSWRLDASDPQALTRLLDLPGLVVTGLEYHDVQESLHLFCQLSATSATCPTCQQPSDYVHQYTRRIVRDLPWAGKPCLLEFLARRFYCPECACPFREDLDWLPRCCRLTQRYRHAVFAACRQTNLRAVSQRERLGYRTVERLYYALAQEQTPWLPKTPVRHLGIDEFALKKGHDQFAVALSDLEAGRIIAVLPDRKKETLLAYFATWSQTAREAVEQVALDLWETYAQVSAACFPKARPVADRFHVMKNLTDRVTTARREIQRALPEATRQTLKGCRWLLVRNEADLSEAD
jgi:transposase